MNYRLGSILVLAAALAGCGNGNVYDLPVADVYARLANHRPEPSNTSPFGRLATNVTGSGGRNIVWSASGTFASRRCTATLTPVDAGSTRVDLSCSGGGASEGAAAGLATNQTRKAVIEMIDARLTGREYDPGRAAGSTAAFWPDDVIDHGNLGTATQTALEMDRQMRQQARESRRQAGGWGDGGSPPQKGGWRSH
jgi:hypothetical protein